MADIEDLVTVNGVTKFEELNCLDCLKGMERHGRHNGVIVDGLRRLTKLCSAPVNSALLLQEKWMKVVFLQNMQRYAADPRIHAFSSLVIGTAIRVYREHKTVEPMFTEWPMLATGVIRALQSENCVPALSANVYGFYLLCGIIDSPQTDDTIIHHLIEEGIVECLATALQTHGTTDDWLVLNCLLVINHLYKISTQETVAPLLPVMETIHGADFQWDKLLEVIGEYNRKSSQ